MTSEIDINGPVEQETEKAILISFSDGSTIWIPKSVIDEDSEVQGVGDTGILVVQSWFAEKHGLV